MRLAQPNIDNFVAGLNEGSSLTTPINQLTQNIASIFQPIKDKGDEDLLNFTKQGLVNSLDKALEQGLKPIEQTEKVISHAQRFLEQMLKQLDKAEEAFYL